MYEITLRKNCSHVKKGWFWFDSGLWKCKARKSGRNYQTGTIGQRFCLSVNHNGACSDFKQRNK